MCFDSEHKIIGATEEGLIVVKLSVSPQDTDIPPDELYPPINGYAVTGLCWPCSDPRQGTCLNVAGCCAETFT